MKLPLKAIVPLLAVVALTAACNPFGALLDLRLVVAVEGELGEARVLWKSFAR